MNDKLSEFFKEREILIVDDDSVSLILLREYLLPINVIVHKASSSYEAISIFSKFSSIALVLLDIRLKDGCGIEVASTMKQIRPEVIIIAQTALIFNEEMFSNNKNLFDSCIYKPFTQQLLINTIYDQIKFYE